jgi:hypothetical protein
MTDELDDEAEASPEDLETLEVEVPWGQRPAWSYGRSGGPTTWVSDPRPESRKRKDEPEPELPRGVVLQANAIEGLLGDPGAMAAMRKKAVVAGWECQGMYGSAIVPVRRLIPAAEDEEHGHYATTLTPTLSASLRMRRDGRAAYALWAVVVAPGEKWTYVGGGIDGRHGVKVTALGKALVGSVE